MFQFRAMNLFAVGAGYLFVATVDKWRPRNSLTVKAQMLQIPKVKKQVTKAELTRYGIPQRDIVLGNPNFRISYDNQKRTPNWVIEYLSYANLKTFRVKCESPFEPDLRIKNKFQTSINDYESQDKFTTFPLVAKNNHRYFQESFDFASKLSNVAPQDLQMTCFWADLESFVRYLTYVYKDLFVITGPLILPDECTKQVEYEVISENQIAVPTHFFKIVIARMNVEGVVSYDVASWLVPNKSIDVNSTLNDYRIEFHYLEKLLGFKMFKDPMVMESFGCVNDVPDFRQKKHHYMDAIGLGHLESVE